MNPVLVVLIIAVVCLIAAIAAVGIRQGKKNAADGVIADFDGLRVTRTELINGYSKNAERVSLAGLTAKLKTPVPRPALAGGATSGKSTSSSRDHTPRLFAASEWPGTWMRKPGDSRPS
jgi:hypothetical protein